MGKNVTINSFFKRKEPENSSVDELSQSPVDLSNVNYETSMPTELERTGAAKVLKTGIEKIDSGSLIRDPALRPQIWDCPPNEQEDLRRAYIIAGPYQPILSEYRFSGPKNHPRRFQKTWYLLHPDWLEYSPTKDAAFCFPCYLISKPSGRPSSRAFIFEGFRNWKKVNDGKNCAFLNHMGKDSNSPHNIAVNCLKDLMNKQQHIETIVEKVNSEEIAKNRLRLKASIDTVRLLTLQCCAFRGHDESRDSLNRGNFVEFLSAFASYNEKVAAVVLDNAPPKASYTSPKIQKQILHIYARKIRSSIREEIGNSKYCIIVDEAQDESYKEQMAIVLRYVDKKGIIRERFFDLVHVTDTTALTLKNEICDVLSRHNLNIQDIRGQGYDGASNMRGEWNGLKALFLKDCQYAYYIHCMAHRLQLALVAASREVIPIHQFFNNLSVIINAINSSCKRQDYLKAFHADEVSNMIETGDLQTGKGSHQIATLQRAGETRWGSHFYSVRNLIQMYSATRSVLEYLITDGKSYKERGDADGAHVVLISFEFVFILHMTMSIMGITNDLCQALQRKYQDILNAMDLVRTTKKLLQRLRDDWNTFWQGVKSFCEKHNVATPDMNAPYIPGRGRIRQGQDDITVEHHYHVDIFNATIDFQLQELDSRFNSDAVELLSLSSALDPIDGYKLFKLDDISKLVDRFYPEDFTKQEKELLKIQLQHYELDVPQHPELKNFSTLSSLCEGLVKTKKSIIYPLIDRLIRLILTLPVSTATGERVFSAMNLVKTSLRNKMEDEYLTDYLVTYVGKDIAREFSSDSIVDEFDDMKTRKVRFR